MGTGKCLKAACLQDTAVLGCWGKLSSVTEMSVCLLVLGASVIAEAYLRFG